MRINFGDTRVRINISFAAVITSLLILDESGLCAIALFCCIIHETAHIVCLMILGEKPALIELSYYGIKLERKPVSVSNGIGDIIVYSAGPAVNIVFAVLLFWLYPESEKIRIAAAISLCTGIFNLLPCRPLDGGNILYAVLCRNTTEEKAEKICFGVLCTVLLPMASAGFVSALRYGNISLCAAAFYVAAVSFFDKKEKGIIKL